MLHETLLFFDGLKLLFSENDMSDLIEPGSTRMRYALFASELIAFSSAIQLENKDPGRLLWLCLSFGSMLGLIFLLLGAFF